MNDLPLTERVRAHVSWYHTLDLAGIETPGWFDLREVVDRVQFPKRLDGLRCLDVATFDGFWAFTMEQRGAAEVVAIDLLEDRSWDGPVDAVPAAVEALAARKARGEGFLLAREALGASVERIERSIYDLDPDVDGQFDFVYVGSLLLHLKNPVGALERVREVCRGQALFVDAIDPVLTLRHPRQPVASLDGVGRPWWWKPNRAALVRMIESAGFKVQAPPVSVLLPPGRGQQRLGRRQSLRALRHPAGREVLMRTYAGDPHLAVLAG